MSESFQKEIDAAIAADDAEELLGVVIDIAMAAEDAVWAADRLTTLAAHGHAGVRGNALAGMGQLIDRFPEHDRAALVAVLRGRLDDEQRYVREQAESVLDELGLGPDD